MQSVSGLSGGYQQLINSIILSEKSPQLRLEQKKSDLKVYKGVLTDLETKLSDFESAIESFTSETSNPFEASTAASASEDASFGITSGSDAALGSHTLKVDRLAQTDTRVSKQFTSSATADAALTGSQTFDITVASPTDADPENRETISVSVNPTGTTNEEVLEEIAASINTAMANAVDDGTLESNQKAQASVVMESSGTMRLSLRSGQTGYTNRLEFNDPDGLLAALDVTANDTDTTTSGGQIYDVGTDATSSKLNSQFVLDGLTLYRDSNSVDDALNDVTLDLQQADGTQYTFSVETDTESIKKEVEDFIKKFNDVQKYLKSKTNVDAESESRGAFAGESAIRFLRYNLRNDAVGTVSGLPTDAPSSFTEVGIGLNSEGMLELEDADKLIEAAETNPSALKDLFGGENGLATKMLEKVEGYTGADGIVSDRKETVDSQMRRIDDKVATFESRLERRREQLTEQFARVQRIQQESFSQQQALAGFFGGVGF